MNTLTSEQILVAAIETAVDKMIAAGMTEAEAAEYAKSHLTEILAFCMKLAATTVK